jgi:hypothetical protein
MIANFDAGTARGILTLRLDVLYQVDSRSELERLPLYLRAQVRPDFSVSTSEITFPAGRDSTQTIEVSPDRAPSVTILKAYSTHPAFHVHAVPPPPGQTKSLVEVRFDEARWAMHRHNNEGELVLHTDSKREEAYRIKIRISPN